MSTRTKLILWVLGIILVVGTVILIWAIDTDRISIFADVSAPSIQTSQELKKLPSPDQSTFSKIFTAIANIFK